MDSDWNYYVFPGKHNRNLGNNWIIPIDNNTPYTPNDDKAKVYKIPNDKSDNVNPCPKGIIPH